MKHWWHSALVTLLERAVGMVFSLGTAVILLRLLRPPEFATWALFILITYFMEMGRSGLIQNGLVRLLALYRQDDPVQYAEVSTASLALNFFFSIIGNVLLWLIMGSLASEYQAPELYQLIPIYSVTNLVLVFLFHFNYVQQANAEFRGIFWSTFWQRGSLFGWVFLGVLLHRPPALYQLAWVMLGGTAMGALFSAAYARPFLRFSFKLNWQWVGRLIQYGKFVLGTNLSTMFYKNIDKLMLGAMLGPKAFAIYDAAGKITQLVETPAFSIAAVVFPQGSARMASEGPQGIKRLYEKSVGSVLALVLPFIVFILLFAEEAVWLLAGSQYAEAAGVLRLTAFFGFFLPFAVQFGTILDATGKPAVNFAYTLFTAVLNLGLNAVYIRFFGIIGAALAGLTGYTVSFLLMQRLLKRTFGIEAWNAIRFVPEFYRLAWAAVKQRLDGVRQKKVITE